VLCGRAVLESAGVRQQQRINNGIVYLYGHTYILFGVYSSLSTKD